MLALIGPGNLLVLDAGSTVSVFAKILSKDSNLIVLTNALEITNILAVQPGITVICTGGRLRDKSMFLQRILAKNAIVALNAEKAFISCSAVDINLGEWTAMKAKPVSSRR